MQKLLLIRLALVMCAMAPPSTDIALTVVKGSGSGYYTTGSRVEIVAEPPAEGMQFIRWGGDIGSVAIPLAPHTTLTLEQPTSLEARYRTADLPQLSHQLDVLPILKAHCAPCHAPGGDYSNLLEFQVLAPRVPSVLSFVQSGYMPPDYPLSTEEKFVLEEWVRRGAQPN